MTSTQIHTVVVHGGAGSQGAPVLRQLIRDGFTVRPITRSQGSRQFQTGTQPVVADLSDRESLENAYKGADAVYLQLPLEFDPSLALQQAQAALSAISTQGVKKVVFNTGLGLTATKVGVPFIDARVQIVNQLPNLVEHYTITGPAVAYAENLILPFSQKAIIAGRAEYPLPESVPVPWVATEDIAAVVSESLTDPNPSPIRIVQGPAALTGDEVAQNLTKASGRPVTWVTISPDRYRELLTPVIGPEAAAGIAASYAAGPAEGPVLNETQLINGQTDFLTWARKQDWSPYDSSIKK